MGAVCPCVCAYLVYFCAVCACSCVDLRHRPHCLRVRVLAEFAYESSSEPRFFQSLADVVSVKGTIATQHTTHTDTDTDKDADADALTYMSLHLHRLLSRADIVEDAVNNFDPKYVPTEGTGTYGPPLGWLLLHWRWCLTQVLLPLLLLQESGVREPAVHT